MSQKVEALPGSQTLFLSCPFFECLYEGTRGPGKSYALLMAYAQHVGKGYGAAWRGIIFRRAYKELADLVQKSQELFFTVFEGVQFLQSTGAYLWRWPSGEELLFRVGVDERDYWSYHGHEYPFIGFDELCTWPNLRLYDSMKSCCRSSKANMPRMIRSTANPYGPGHNAVKSYFIDPAPPGVPVADDMGRERVRIYGSIWENHYLLDNDPDYVKTLMAETNEARRKAWLEGDWDIVAGGMFDDLWQESIHVIEPFNIPSNWRVDRGFDWGSSKPFAVLWFAQSNGEELPDGRCYSRNSIIVIAEWYGWNGKPNEGCRMIASEIARGILEREKFLKTRVRPGPADSAIYAVQNGKSIADDMAAAGVRWEPADKGKGSRVNGWERMREMLKNAATGEGAGLYVFDTCRHAIRTLPVAPRDEKNPDDLDSDSEDHILDVIRYRASYKPTVTKSREVAI